MAPLVRKPDTYASPPTPSRVGRFSNDLLPLVLTIGDPTGIGPEITARWLSEVFTQSPFPLMVLGDIGQLTQVAESFHWPLPQRDVQYVSVSGNSPGDIAYRTIEAAVEKIAQKQAGGLVTGPISKANLWSAGIHANGHTEILADLANRHWPTTPPHQSDMLFQYGGFRVLLLTRHVPLARVSEHLTVEGVVTALEQLIAYLQTHAGLTTPRIALLGVNPHAGEIGGTEERDVLLPAREMIMQRHNVYISEPLAADGVFRGFDATNPPYHAYVAPSHDQGLIPMKLVGNFAAVNITIGLPFVRTSVSHGVAMDCVGTGQADITGLTAAINLGRQLTAQQSITAYSQKPTAPSAMG